MVERVADALVEPVELGQTLGLELGVTRERLKKTGSERSVNPFKELEIHQADAVPPWPQSITSGMGQFLDELLGSQLGQIG